MACFGVAPLTFFPITHQAEGAVIGALTALKAVHILRATDCGWFLTIYVVDRGRTAAASPAIRLAGGNAPMA
jgi:hypothetical protein